MKLYPPPPRSLVFSLAVVLAVLSYSARAGSSAVAATDVVDGFNSVTATIPIAKAGKPITDDTGRVRYIVDLIDDEVGKPSRFQDANEKIKYHKDKSDQLIADVIKVRGIELRGTTSLVGISFVAYLDAKQIDQLAKDKRVKLMTQDTYLQPSALWNSYNDGWQERPWGLYAMGVANAGSSNGTATVYLLDNGVQLHPDLTGLTAANQLTAIATTASGQPVNPVGCYPHATHVAGIIGASVNNYSGVVGVLPGVKLVSMALADMNVGTCSDGPLGYPISGFTQGLDKIATQVLVSGKVGIINISYNAAGVYSSTGTIGQKMKVVSTPVSFVGGGYKGAFIVQSAGNQFVNACSTAYDATNTYDGIMVVGGLDDNGQPVAPLNSVGTLDDGGYRNSGINERGSNFGSCVEVWAPSQRIRSTWSSGSYAFLSGTSMAAPHVAGFAARLLESDPSIATSWALEDAVRARLSTITGSYLVMPQLVNSNSTAVPTVEIAETTTRSSASAINFNKLPTEINLRYQAVGASQCYVTVTRNGVAYSAGYMPTSSALSTNASMAGAAYAWTVTCYSSAGTSTTVTANGFIKRPVNVAWIASTTSTGNSWQTLSDGATVSWSVAANAPFNQRSGSNGADACRVQSYGFKGNTNNDANNPVYPFYGYSERPLFVQTLLWDSGNSFPTYYTFATFYFGNSNVAAPPLGSYEGYKWLLTCWNAEGVSKSTVMYGKPGP